jgi:integrase
MAGTTARGGTVTAVTGAERTLGAAVDAFLARPRPVTTARTYTRTLERLAGELGRDRPLAGITSEDLDGAASPLWGSLAPRTWNRHLATVGSFLAWCRRHGWPAGNLQLRAGRRAAPEDDTRAIPLPGLERLWSRADIPLRERALWRLLYDSAARAGEVLGLDVGDLDLANRQARARPKGGHVRPLHFQTAAARLLARLTAGHQTGPVFLTARRAAAHRAAGAVVKTTTSSIARTPRSGLADTVGPGLSLTNRVTAGQRTTGYFTRRRPG